MYRFATAISSVCALSVGNDNPGLFRRASTAVGNWFGSLRNANPVDNKARSQGLTQDMYLNAKYTDAGSCPSETYWLARTVPASTTGCDRIFHYNEAYGFAVRINGNDEVEFRVDYTKYGEKLPSEDPTILPIPCKCLMKGEWFIGAGEIPSHWVRAKPTFTDRTQAVQVDTFQNAVYTNDGKCPSDTYWLAKIDDSPDCSALTEYGGAYGFAIDAKGDKVTFRVDKDKNFNDLNLETGELIDVPCKCLMKGTWIATEGSSIGHWQQK